MRMPAINLRSFILTCALLLAACSQADVPKPRNVSIPAPTAAHPPDEAINGRPDSVMYLPLGDDVLMPEVSATDQLPSTPVGPFELRGETVAGALQLILADYDVPLAFQTDDGLNRKVTVANLKGPLNKVISHVCGLANLYCAYEDGMITVKDTQTFTVKVPPISQDTSFMDNVATGLAAIIGKAPIVDKSTRTIIYEATNRNSEMAERYFQRMRSSTALIVFETYIWEVSLNSGNSTGIQWDQLIHFGKYTSSLGVVGAVGSDFTNPISIGLPSATKNVTPTDVFNFLSTYGAVKTVSQPQITVLSGSQAKLRAADKQNYVSKISETLDNGQSTTSVDTDSVDTGFTITIDSAWDNATVYATIAISLTDVASIENFNFTTSGTNGGATTVQLPKTTEREVNTQVRVRPGDSLLIAGLVRENDNLTSSGPGVTQQPIIPTSRTATAQNLELVFMMRPRVVVFASPGDEEYRKSIRQQAGPAAADLNPGAPAKDAHGKDLTFTYDFAPLTAAPADSTTPAAKRIIPAKAGARHKLPPVDNTPTDTGDQSPPALPPSAPALPIVPGAPVLTDKSPSGLPPDEAPTVVDTRHQPPPDKHTIETVTVPAPADKVPPADPNASSVPVDLLDPGAPSPDAAGK